MWVEGKEWAVLFWLLKYGLRPETELYFLRHLVGLWASCYAQRWRNYSYFWGSGHSLSYFRAQVIKWKEVGRKIPSSSWNLALLWYLTRNGKFWTIYSSNLGMNTGILVSRRGFYPSDFWGLRTWINGSQKRKVRRHWMIATGYNCIWKLIQVLTFWTPKYQSDTFQGH